MAAMRSTRGWNRNGSFRCPPGLSLRESMILGTAGFTAALALYRMLDNRQTPELGPLAVTGATGGVGSLAVDIFSSAGFEVHAVSGKADQADYLKSIGASEVLGREALDSKRPMESARFGGGLDNVGGAMLASLLAQTAPYGNVASRRPRRQPRPADHGDALHHPRRLAAGRGLGRNRPRHPRRYLAASGRRLETAAPGDRSARGKRRWKAFPRCSTACLRANRSAAPWSKPGKRDLGHGCLARRHFPPTQSHTTIATGDNLG